MATATFLIITALAASQQTIDPVIIPTDGTQTCPSQEDQESVLLNIKNDAWIIITNFTLIPECGDGLRK